MIMGCCDPQALHLADVTSCVAFDRAPRLLVNTSLPPVNHDVRVARTIGHDTELLIKQGEELLY